MVNFDYGVASIFGQWQAHMGDEHASIRYVGVFKDILRLDYGPISTPIILMRCAWVQNESDVKGNPTYRRNEVGFLLANFQYMKVEEEGPFLFPTQAQQVFFIKEEQNPY